ncbi:MAG: enoyl-CoA hydratase/isomerase family protein [Bacteroidia bacterium]|nr:enoyl-CoA hydratase/isomerase family protein [Bacteroidia bacterium]
MYNSLLYEVKDGIATITLNRPDRYNAFDNELSAEFINALKKTQYDPEVRVIVITGAGKAFCSGQDLKDAPKHNLGESVAKRYNPMIRLITGIPKPFVCRLNGVAAGAGASIPLACDYVVAAENVRMVWAFVNIGLVTDSGSSWFLPRLVGRQKAFELACLGDSITAKEAQQMGLINQVVAHEELDAEVQKIAGKLAKSATKAIGLMKRMLNRSFESSLEEALEQEMWGQEIAGRSEDYAEGTNAFNEKRSPVFKGK